MLIPLLEFNKYISKFEIMALYMHHMLHYHNNIISVYNAFNEYLFYENSTVENIPVSDFIEKTIGDTFNTFTEDLSYLGTNSSQIPGLYDVFIKVQQEQLCKNYLCDPYIETLTSLGFFSFIAFMTVEIKVKVNNIITRPRHLNTTIIIGPKFICSNSISTLNDKRTIYFHWYFKLRMQNFI